MRLLQLEQPQALQRRPGDLRIGKPTQPSIAGGILAGGGSRRMERPKAALPIAGEPFVARISRILLETGLAPRIVVAGTHARETWDALPPDDGIVRLANPAPERGQLSSLKVALRWLVAETSGCPAVLVALVDHPAVAGPTYRALRDAAADAAAGAAVFVPTHRGRRGHPVVFARSVWEELLALPDTASARVAVHRDPAR